MEEVLVRERGVTGLAEEDGTEGRRGEGQGKTEERARERGRRQHRTTRSVISLGAYPHTPRPVLSFFLTLLHLPATLAVVDMGKHTTHLVQRASPLAVKTHRVRFSKFARPVVTHVTLIRRTSATRSAQHQKAPFITRPNVSRSPALRSRLHSTNTNRFLSARSQLSTICEEPEEDESEHQLDEPRELYRPLESWAHEDARPGPSRRHGHDDDVDMLAWDDETTLVAMLQEE